MGISVFSHGIKKHLSIKSQDKFKHFIQKYVLFYMQKYQ